MSCVADDLFRLSHPRDFDATPTKVGGCSTYSLCSTLPCHHLRDAKKVHLFLGPFPNSPMLYVFLTIFSSLDQSSDC